LLLLVPVVFFFFFADVGNSLDEGEN